MGTHHPIRKQVAAEPVVIPDRLYFRIGDVAKLCGVQPYVLRFWETEFPQLKPNKGGTGQRLYRRKDVEMALRIKSLLYEQGYTIPGARLLLKSGAAATDTPAAGSEATTHEIAAHEPAPQPATDAGEELRRRAHLADLREELHELVELLRSPLPGQATAVHAAAQPATAQSVVAQRPPHEPIPFRPQLVVQHSTQQIEAPKPAAAPASEVPDEAEAETAFDPAAFEASSFEPAAVEHAATEPAEPVPARPARQPRAAKADEPPALPLFQGDLFGRSE